MKKFEICKIDIEVRETMGFFLETMNNPIYTHEFVRILNINSEVPDIMIFRHMNNFRIQRVVPLSDFTDYLKESKLELRVKNIETLISTIITLQILREEEGKKDFNKSVKRRLEECPHVICDEFTDKIIKAFVEDLINRNVPIEGYSKKELNQIKKVCKNEFKSKECNSSKSTR